jgi:hypothetical protein
VIFDLGSLIVDGIQSAQPTAMASARQTSRIVSALT